MTAETNHTPGPWTYTTNPENTRFIIDSEPAHAIACTAGFESNNEANARLIAAAPELLESAKELASHVREMCRVFRIPEPTASLDRYDAAIAKATGETQ